MRVFGVLSVALLADVQSYVLRHALLRPEDRVVVAVSGGPDSVALCHLLVRLQASWRLTLHVVHVDHGLRPDSRSDADFVRQLCDEWQVPVTIVTVDVRIERRPGESTQQAARRLRLAALRRVFADIGAQSIALGHHQDDQAETLLLRLLRGTGTTGLGAMRPRRGPFIRPLLDIPRARIEQYCREHDLNVLHDPSNESSLYVRNRIRRHLLPLLQAEYNPHMAERLARTAELLQADDALLESLAAAAYKRARVYASDGLTDASEAVEAPFGPKPRAREDAESSATVADPHVASVSDAAVVPRGASAPDTHPPVVDSGSVTAEMLVRSVVLSIEAFRREHEALRRRVIRRALRDAGADLRRVTYDHTHSVVALLEDPAAGALTLPGRIRVERDGDFLIFGARPDVFGSADVARGDGGASLGPVPEVEGAGQDASRSGSTAHDVAGADTGSGATAREVDRQEAASASTVDAAAHGDRSDGRVADAPLPPRRRSPFLIPGASGRRFVVLPEPPTERILHIPGRTVLADGIVIDINRTPPEARIDILDGSPPGRIEGTALSGRPEGAERTDPTGRSEAAGGTDRIERPEPAGRSEVAEGTDRIERPEPAGRSEAAEGTALSGRPEGAERTDPTGRSEVAEGTDRIERPEPAGRSEAAGGTDRLKRPEPAARFEAAKRPRVLATAVLDGDSLKLPLRVRSRQPGDRMRPAGLGGSKKLQDIFVDEKVPRYVRDRVPVIHDETAIVWIPGWRTDERAMPGINSRNILYATIMSL